MIVSWKDEAGVTHWGDDNSKAYKQHRERKAEKPGAEAAAPSAPAATGAVVKTPTPEAETKRK